MNFTYNPLLVMLSVLVAVQASYVGLSLARHIAGAFALNRRLLIAGSAISLAVGIWSMHFIGMLAARTAFRLNYDVLPTLVSFLVCVLVTGTAVYLACLRSRHMLVVAASIMGSGIAAMHYIGMVAVHSSTHMTHDPAFVIASIIIAVAASGLALWLAFAARKRPPLLVCAAVLGCAISGMHYMAMAGTVFHHMGDGAPSTGSVMSEDLLAVIVSIVAFSVSGLFMLILIPGDHGDSRDTQASNRQGGGLATPALAVVDAQPQQAHASGPELAVPITQQPAIVTATLPFERQGHRFHIEVRQIISVHANAHYTYLFNGREDLFCPLSITEIAARLPGQNFFRTHRSYVVNLAHVMQIRKAGDGAIAELDAQLRRTVPVSRSKIGPLRQQLAAFQASLPDTQNRA